jgi:uncharacterized Zn-binding protein involved in type VI secretion
MSNQEAANQSGSFIVVSESPDACRTPLNNVPVPYMIVARLDEALSVSPNVSYQGKPVILADETCIAHCTGAEAGTGGGVKSGTHNGEVRFIEGASTLRVNGKHLVRTGDRVSMNNGNTFGTVVCLSDCAPICSIGPGGIPTADCNPPQRAPLHEIE